MGVYFSTYLISGLISILVSGPSDFIWLLKEDYKDPAAFIQISLITVFPYVVFGFIWVIALSDKKQKNYKERKKGIIGALIGIAVINFVLYLDYYLDLLIGDVSSTGSLIFFFFPFCSIICGGIGYAVGYSVSQKVEVEE
jgi:hypothetical protein